MITRRQFLLGAAGAVSALGAAADRPRAQNGNAKRRVVVVGGGYGGVTAARYLKLAEPRLEVVLIHRDREYLSCPGSNEVIAGMQPVVWLARRYEQLTRRYGIRTLCGEVTGLDVDRRIVTLGDRSHLPFDRAILSPGIAFRWSAWEGYGEEASRRCPHAWQAGAQTELLRQQLRSLRPGGTVMIVSPPNPYRCPPGPYERAGLMAFYLKRHNPRAKVLILDTKTQFSKQALFLQGWNELYPGMVEWIPASTDGDVERIDADRRIVYSEFGEHRADVLNVIPPQKAGAIAEIAGLTDKSGWCPVDPRSFASTLAPDIHIIGDACIAAPMPKSAFAANSQGKVCAHAVEALLAGRDPGPPSLINHCYSFLAPEYAISITGVYEYSPAEGGLVAAATGETPMDADRKTEAKQARAWQKNFQADVFG